MHLKQLLLYLWKRSQGTCKFRAHILVLIGEAFKSSLHFPVSLSPVTIFFFILSLKKSYPYPDSLNRIRNTEESMVRWRENNSGLQISYEKNQDSFWSFSKFRVDEPAFVLERTRIQQPF